MIVEFIGCTGAGKTTLISQILSELAGATQVHTAHELVAGRLGLGAVANPTASNLVEEMAALPYFLASLPQHRAYIALTIRLFARDTRLSLATINNLRSLERKIGGYEIARRHDRDAIVLVDEGPIQAAHMFAFNATPPGPAEIARFAALVPLPDLVVYVRSSVDALVRRTLTRSDAPRQIRGRSSTSTEVYIRRAVAVFDRLVQTERLSDRVLIAEDNGHEQRAVDDLAGRVAQWILESELNRSRTRLSDQLIPELS